MRRVTAADAESPDLCREAAIRLLDRRWHAREELRRKLARRGFSPGAIEAAFVRLAAAGWLNDERFAASVARERTRRGLGPLRVRRELVSRGVSHALAVSSVDSARTEEQGDEILTRVASRRAASLSRRYGADWAADDTARKKFLAYLLQQGYDYAAAASAFKAVTGGEPDFDAPIDDWKDEIP